jgi:hypothetical protein
MDSVFIDETFDLNQSKNYYISIQAGLNGYSFSVLDPIRNKYVLLKHFPFPEELTVELLEEKIDEINGNDEFLTREYKSVLFAYQGPKYTIIPEPLFKKDNLRTYFEFNHFLEEYDEIHYNQLRNIDAFNLFVIPSRLAMLIKRSFTNVRYFHHVTPFIENGLMEHGAKGSKTTVLVNLYGGYADIVVTGGGRMLLCNTFPWKTEQDLVYFILYIYEQLKLQGEETPLVISGELKKDSSTYDLLKNYIKKVNFERRNDHFIYSYTLNEIDHHWFTNLYNIRLCV